MYIYTHTPVPVLVTRFDWCIQPPMECRPNSYMYIHMFVYVYIYQYCLSFRLFLCLFMQA